MEFKKIDSLYKRNEGDALKNIVPSYLIGDAIFYVEPNFYTQLENLEVNYKDEYNKILLSLGEISKKNKRVIFTGNFDAPILHNLEGFIYRDINDVLAYNKLTFDIKINPESDWKD